MRKKSVSFGVSDISRYRVEHDGFHDCPALANGMEVAVSMIGWSRSQGAKMAVSDEKDRYGDQLRNIEKASEDQWAAERDRELIAELRRRSEERVGTKQPPEKAIKVFNRVLCPIDVRESSSLAALDLAGRIAGQNGAELYLLHVCSTITIPLGGSVTDRVLDEASAKRKLEEIATEHLGDIQHSLLVITGDAAERVINIQSALNADLIVMGTHGRRGVPRFFLGSVAERVVREATCPVLTIRPDNASRSEPD